MGRRTFFRWNERADVADVSEGRRTIKRRRLCGGATGGAAADCIDQVARGTSSFCIDGAAPRNVQG